VHHLGIIASQAGHFDEAYQLISRAIALNPADASAHSNLSQVLTQLGRLQESMQSAQNALQIDPNHVDALNNYAVMLEKSGFREEAITQYEKLLAAHPDHASALSNYGAILFDLGRYDEALDHYNRALARQPDFPNALNNRGLVLTELHRNHEAVADYINARTLTPSYTDAYWNEALSRLLIGDFAGGLQLYEFRWAKGGILEHAKREFSVPRLQSLDQAKGKTVLLYSEQGLGDTIQFSRYATLLHDAGASVLLEVPAPLKAILETIAGATAFSTGEILPSFDFQCPLMSLPLVFKTEWATVPGNPYIRANPILVERWRNKLGPQQRLRVGLVWSGNSTNKKDPERSIPLSKLARLLEFPADFFCLQTDVRPEDKAILESSNRVHAFSDDEMNFASTAGLIECMDLVISVDTSIAHLAGAMGKPVYILLAYKADWRWMLYTTSSAWYPSAKLLRQAQREEWDAPIDALMEEMRYFQSDKGGG
jgi:Flp pilus assembly protein TadD